MRGCSETYCATYSSGNRHDVVDDPNILTVQETNSMKHIRKHKFKHNRPKKLAFDMKSRSAVEDHYKNVLELSKRRENRCVEGNVVVNEKTACKEYNPAIAWQTLADSATSHLTNSEPTTQARHLRENQKP